MSEKTNKKPEGTEEKEPTTTKKSAAKKPEKEKKEFFLKRWKRGVIDWMSEHPVLNSVISGAAGGAAAVGAGYTAKRVIDKRNEKKYGPANNDDPNS